MRPQYAEIYHSLAGGRRSGRLSGVRSRKEGTGELRTFGKFAATRRPTNPQPKGKMEDPNLPKVQILRFYEAKRKTEVSRHRRMGFIAKKALRI